MSSTYVQNLPINSSINVWISRFESDTLILNASVYEKTLSFQAVCEVLSVREALIVRKALRPFSLSVPEKQK